MLCGMPAMSEIRTIHNAHTQQTSASKYGIPDLYAPHYRFLFNQGIEHIQVIIDDVIARHGLNIDVPMQAAHLEQYCSGYTFEYKTFYKIGTSKDSPEGFWQISETDPSHVTIHYNRNAPVGRQRHSQIHEMMHFVQSIDPPFLEFMDDIILNSILPEHLVVKLLHRLTDKAASMYLMPEAYFKEIHHEIYQQDGIFGEPQIRKLARAFDVSVQSATYRLQECSLM